MMSSVDESKNLSFICHNRIRLGVPQLVRRRGSISAFNQKFTNGFGLRKLGLKFVQEFTQ